MKKKSSENYDDLRPHYDFDFKNMKPNRFASDELIHKQGFVVLDEDVSRVFNSSESVNDALRTMMHSSRNTGAKRSRNRKSPKKRAS
jgi:hypothetical protein